MKRASKFLWRTTFLSAAILVLYMGGVAGSELPWHPYGEIWLSMVYVTIGLFVLSCAIGLIAFLLRAGAPQ